MYVKRIDTPKGRWYQKYETPEDGGEDILVAQGRSVTNILKETMPMSIGLMKYFGQMGYEGGIEHRDLMGVRGTALHIAVGKFLQGHAVDTRVSDSAVA